MTKHLFSALLFSSALCTVQPVFAATAGIDGFTTSGGFDSFEQPKVSGNGSVMGGTYIDIMTSDYMPYIFTGGSFQTLPLLVNGTYGWVSAISADGSIVVGTSETTGGQSLATKWINGGAAQSLGTLLPGADSNAYAISADGLTIVGQSVSQAVKWVNGGSIQALGLLAGGNTSTANAVSDDGNVIVGTSQNGSFQFRPVRWTGGGAIEELDVLATGNSGVVLNVSGDGSTAVGWSNAAGFTNRAVRWSSGSTAVYDLDLDVSTVTARAIASSHDGSVIIGEGRDGSNNYQALRWINNDPVQMLGALAGDLETRAYSMTTDGSVTVGYSGTGGTNTAVRWVGNAAPESISSVLTSEGVSLTGWNLEIASGISGDGDVVVGSGTRNGDAIHWIANLASGGVTTPGDISESVSTVSQASQAVMQTASSQMGQSLFVARHMVSRFPNTNMPTASSANDLSDIGTAAGGPQPSTWELYTIGGVGLGSNNDYSNNNFNGTIGVKRRVTTDLGIGAGIIGSTGRTNLAFNGQSDMDALGGSVITAYEPESGLRLYGSAFAADINVDTTRGYLNGASLDSSRGKTNGTAYGAAVQGGWSFPVSEKSSVMPYIEGRWSKTKLDAYNETGGAFAGSFSSQDQDNVASRIGFEHNYLVTPTVNFSSRLAWGHRLSGNGNGVTASVGGLTQTMAGDAGDRDWAEAAVGATWRASPATTLGAELSGRSGETSEPQLGLVASASIAF